MRSAVRWRYLAGFGVLLLVLAVVGTYADRTAATAAARVEETRGTGDELIRFGELLSMIDQEQSAVHGFVITGQPEFLALYDSAVARMAPLMGELQALAGTDTLERRGLDSVRTLMQARIAVAASQIRIRRASGAAAVTRTVATGTGARLTDLARLRLRGLEQAHIAERERDIAEMAATAGATRRVVATGWLVALLAVLAASLLAHHGLRRRELAETRVRELADALQDLYDHAPVGYHSLDAGGGVVRMNRTELGWLGYAADEVVGRRPFVDLLAPESREAFRVDFERFKATGEVHDLKYGLLRRDGSTLPVLLSATAVRDAAGRFVMSRAVAVDVSERRRMEAVVKTLSGLLPICSSCKKIRDDRGYWNQLETYISAHSEAEFSHAVCPECLQRLYPHIAAKPSP